MAALIDPIIPARAHGVEAALKLLPSTDKKAAPSAAAVELEEAWDKLAAKLADRALDGVTPEQATALLMDLLPYPEHSHERECRMPANLDWCYGAQAKARDFLSKRGLSDPGSQRSRNLCGPGSKAAIPPLHFAAARMEALAKRGADPRASNALGRAVFRKSEREVAAALAMPGCPKPGEVTNGKGSPMHRAAYAGPNAVFAMLARACSPEEWSARDADGCLPIEKALMSRNKGRAKAILAMAPLHLEKPDHAGNTPLHRLAMRMGMGHFNPSDPCWAVAFELHVKTFGAGIFEHRNNAGQTVFDLGMRPHLKSSMEERFFSETVLVPEAGAGGSKPKMRL